MADNTILSSGSGGDTIATDDISGVKYPRSKITIGADGVTDGDVSATNPMPVKGTGSAGTANAGVVTVQGIASMTPVLATLSGTNNIATLTTVTSVSTLSTITNVVHIDDNSGSITVDGTVAISGTVTVGSHAVTNAGTFAVQESGTWVQVDDAAFTPATSKIAMIGFQADESSTDSVDEGDGGCPRMTLDRKIITNPQPHTAGGLTVTYNLDVDESEDDVKTSPGCLYKIRITNRTTSVRYVKLYNDTAANVTVGSTTPLDIIPVPANATDYTVLTESFGGMGLAFSVALSIAATTGFAVADTGAPGTNDIIATLYYK